MSQWLICLRDHHAYLFYKTLSSLYFLDGKIEERKPRGRGSPIFQREVLCLGMDGQLS